MVPTQSGAHIVVPKCCQRQKKSINHRPVEIVLHKVIGTVATIAISALLRHHFGSGVMSLRCRKDCGASVYAVLPFPLLCRS